jgi:catechol 2,3-dioxygenase-like lactoylglutathione lyase family enzyme
MITDLTIHPQIQHFGLTTGNLDAMLDWYHKVLGMTVNHRSEVPAEAHGRVPFSASAFISNDDVHHRIAIFEVPDIEDDQDRYRHKRVQHVAFEYESLEDLLGTYARLKALGILPIMAADQGVQTAIYYLDPDQNTVEINVNSYGNEWTGTEYIRTASPTWVMFDPDKMVAALEDGQSAWAVHEEALAGRFPPTTPPNPAAFL